MKLYLVRHGRAEPPRPSVSDLRRPLSADGRDEILRAARGLRELGVTFDLILSSPLDRARETAEILAAELGGVGIRTVAPLSSGTSAEEILRAASDCRDRERLAIIGHHPDLGRFASLLLVGSGQPCPLAFRPGAVACLSGELLPGAAQGQLEWFLTAAQLGRLAPA